MAGEPIEVEFQVVQGDIAARSADQRGCESVVFPALGCGAAGFDLETGAGIIGETIASFDPEHLVETRFIGYSDEEAETIRRATAGIDG